MQVSWRGLELPASVDKDAASATDTFGRFTAEPFVRGLLRGLGRRFGLEVRVDDAPADTSRARFVVHRLAGPESAWTSSR